MKSEERKEVDESVAKSIFVVLFYAPVTHQGDFSRIRSSLTLFSSLPPREMFHYHNMTKAERNKKKKRNVAEEHYCLCRLIRHRGEKKKKRCG